MRPISSLMQRVRSRRRYREFSAMPNSLLTLFAIATGLVMFGYGLMLSRAVTWYVSAVETVGWLNFDAIFWGLWISTVVILAWTFTAMFSRCERLLRDRWFQ